MNVEALTEILKVTGFSAGGVLLAGVIGFLKGWIVPGYLYQQLLKERDESYGRLDAALGITRQLSADKK